MSLPETIDRLWGSCEPEAEPVEGAIRLLDAGEARVA